MKYNELINELLDLLDKANSIIKFKELKDKLLNDKAFLEKIKNVNLDMNLNNKKKLYENIDYVEYLKLETNIKMLICSIKNKFNFISRSCRWKL